MWITSSLKAAKTPVNIALGNFDGVHLGHRRVVAQILGSQLDEPPDQLLNESAGSLLRPDRPARQPANRLNPAIELVLGTQSVAALHLGIQAIEQSHWQENPPDFSQLGSSQLAPSYPEALNLPLDLATEMTSATFKGSSIRAPLTTVVTFSPHPQEYFSGVAKPLLTPVAEKSWQLAQLGIEQLVMLPFDQALADLSPQAFVEQILVKGLEAKRISVGSDFRFGKGRCGDADGLQAIAASYGIPVIQVPLKYEKGDRISSSRIREALQTGHLTEATQLLGRPYTLTGRVIKGQQLGRTLGFPTANLQLPAKKYLPRTGVYSVRVYGAETGSPPEFPPTESFTPSISRSPAAMPTAPLKGVMNIGTRPTVAGQALSVEVHLLDWTGDLYGQLLTVSLERFIRAEQKFESLAALKAQIGEDCRAASRS